MNDLQIIELYWKRNEAAISETGYKYGKLLHSISYSIVKNTQDSEEIVNDTYGKAWDSMPPQKPNSLSAYLGRITRNLSINRWQECHAKKRFSGACVLLSELSECIPSKSDVEQEAEADQLTILLEKWLRSLALDDRILFMRRYWYGDSVITLAFKFGTSANKLAGRLYRLRQSLKSFLEEEGISV